MGGWVAVNTLQVYAELCVCMYCTEAAMAYHTSDFQRACVCVFVHIRMCVCICIMTVIPYDRMITPFSPQLRGISQLHSTPSAAPQRSCMLPHMSERVSCGQRHSSAPLSLSLSHPTRAISRDFQMLNY